MLTTMAKRMNGCIPSAFVDLDWEWNNMMSEIDTKKKSHGAGASIRITYQIFTSLLVGDEQEDVLFMFIILDL